MNTQDLLESAVLDALGLLDEDERAEFDRAFSAAGPQVQAMVRAEQSRVASDDSLLPDVQPPAELRGRVLAAVRNALVGEAAGNREVAGRIHSGSGVSSGAISGRRRVSSTWRTSTLAFAAAVAVLASLTAHMQSQLSGIRQVLSGEAQVAELAGVSSPGFAADVLAAKIAIVPLTVIEGAEHLVRADSVTFSHREQTDEVVVFAQNLERLEGVTYQVVVERPGAEALALGEFEGGPGIVHQGFKAGNALANPEARVALYAVRNVGGRLVKTAVMVA